MGLKARPLPAAPSKSNAADLRFAEVEAAFRRGGTAALARVIRAHLDRAVADRLLAAIAPDRRFLARRPEALFQVVHNRCYWIDPPRPERYYRYAPGVRLPVAAAALELLEQVEAWHLERERADGTRWLRTCKPLSPWAPSDPARPVRQLRGHRGPLLDLAASHDGRLLLSRSADQVSVWCPVSGEQILVLDTVADEASFSPDGRAVITRSGPGATGLLSHWSIDTGAMVAREAAPNRIAPRAPAPAGPWVVRRQGADAVIRPAGGGPAIGCLPHRISSSTWADTVVAAITDAGELLLYEVREPMIGYR